MIRVRTAFQAALLLFLTQTLFAQVPQTTVELGMVEELSRESQGPFLEETVSALRADFARNGMALNVTRASEEEIARLVRQNRLDFFLAPSDLYRRLLLSGCSDIAVTHAAETTNPNRTQGALFLSRLGEEPDVPRSVSKGKVLRLGGEAGSVIVRGELIRHGLS